VINLEDGKRNIGGVRSFFGHQAISLTIKKFILTSPYHPYWSLRKNRTVSRVVEFAQRPSHYTRALRQSIRRPT